MSFLINPYQVQPAVVAAGITFVGSTQGNAAAGSTAAYGLPAGLQENDIVLVAQFSDAGTPNLAAGWTSLVASAPYLIAYKIMGAVPDTTYAQTAWNANRKGFIAVAFRGADTTTPLDVAATTASGTGNPNAPSITPVTNGAAVLAWGFLDDDVVTVDPLGSGYGDDIEEDAGEAAEANSTGMFAWILQATAAAIDPPAFVTTGSDAWFAATVALRPA